MNLTETDPLDKFHIEETSQLFSSMTSLLDDVLKASHGAHPSFLGHGSSWQGFEFEHQGQLLVAKISNGITHTPHATDQSARSLLGGTEIPGLEHLVGVDSERGIVITTRVPGKRLIDLSKEELEAIPDEHFKQAVETLKFETSNHIIFDAKPSNFLYDPENGFGFIDYMTDDLQSPYDFDYRIEKAISGFGTALTNVGIYERPITTLEDKQKAIPNIESGLKAADRLVEISKGQVPDESHKTISSTLKYQKARMLDTIANYKSDLGQGPRPEPPQGAWWER
jgi:hypothetical protein